MKLIWDVVIKENAPLSFYKDDFKYGIFELLDPIMDSLESSLYDAIYRTKDLSFEEALESIIDELPIMTPIYEENILKLKYNRWVDLQLSQDLRTIHRDIKINKIILKLDGKRLL